MKPNHSQLQLSYQGPAVDAGSMDVRELAPALLAFGALVQESNRLLNGSKSEVSVQVNADFKRGSFTVDLITVQTFGEHIKQAILGTDVKTVKEIFELLFGGGGVIAVLRMLKGRKPKKTTKPKSGNVQIMVDNSKLEVKQEVYLLIGDEAIRRETRGVLLPLEKPGVEAVAVSESGEERARVTKEELSYFASTGDGPEGEVLAEATREAVFAIVKPSFEDRLRWTLSDGNATFGAYLKDEDFLRRVHRREVTFGAGDYMRAQLHYKTVRTDSGLQTTYSVLRVHEVIENPAQKRLPYSEDEED